MNSQTRPSETAQRERLDVDAGQLDLRRVAGGRNAVDEVAVGDGEEHAIGGGRVLDDVVVEHRLFDRDRERLVGAEANRVGKLPRVVDGGPLEDADAGAAAADADADVLAREVGRREEGGDLVGECLGVPHLAAGDDVGRKRVPRGLDELRVAVVHDDGRGELGGADAEPHELLVPAAGARRGCLLLLRRTLRLAALAFRLFLLLRRGALGLRRRLALEGEVLLQ